MTPAAVAAQGQDLLILGAFLLLVALAAALVVAFARVAGGVHWPSDALGGLALGAVAAVLAQFGFNWFDQRARAAAASGIVSGS